MCRVVLSCLNTLPWTNIEGVELWNNILTSYAEILAQEITL